MSNPDFSVYQIIAVLSDNEQAESMRAQLGNKPFHIGSGENTNLQLQSSTIAPVHVRVLLTTDGRVILTNLGDHKTIALDGKPLNAFVPTLWLPHASVQLGSYQLQLVSVTSKASESFSQDAHASVHDLNPPTIDFQQMEDGSPHIDQTINFSHEVSDESGANGVDGVVGQNEGAVRDGTMIFEDVGDKFDYNLLDVDVPIGQNNSVSIDEVVTPLSLDEEGGNSVDEVQRGSADIGDKPDRDMTLHNPAPLPSVDDPSDNRRHIEQVPTGELWQPTEQFLQTPLKPIDEEVRAQITPPQAATDAGVSQNTLPRVWYYAGYIGAQLLHSPLRFVAGERVRVPISIQNRHHEPLSLHLVTAGIPRDWLILPVLPIELAPREIRLVDLILITPVTFKQNKAELLVRLSDTARSDTILTLTQEMIYKSNPNIIGHLQPAVMTDREPGSLYLQNHTQSTIQIFITQHLDAEDVLLKTAETQFNLPPGQVVSVPLYFEVRSRAMFASKRYRFAVVVAQNRRASLDYPGEVIVLPRLRAIHLLIAFIMTMILIALLMIAGRGGVTAVVVSPSPLPAFTQTTTVEQVIPTTAEPTKPPA